MNLFERPHALPSSLATRRRPSHSVIVRFVVTAFLLLIIAHLLLSSEAGHRRRFTCAVCRLNRVDDSSKFTGTATRFQESTCSKWYPANIESSHDHVWVRSSTIAILNYYGQTIGIGDNDEVPGRVIWRLTPEQQVSVYKRFSDPMEAKALFTSLTAPDIVTNHRDFDALASLRNWMDSASSEPWQSDAELKR